MDERYTNSLIDSINDYIYNLQYLATNKVETLRDLSFLKILHQLYDRADWYEVSEADKSKLEKLINCVIMHNSDLTLPTIIPGKYYSNVNTPQTIYTWQKLTDLNTVEVSHKYLYVNSENISSVPIVVERPDFYNNGNGVTSFVRIYAEGTITTITAPSTEGENSFSYWRLDGIPQTLGQFSIEVDMTTNHTLTAVYEVYVVPTGTLTITKNILSNEGIAVEDNTIFTVTINGGTISSTWVRNLSQEASVFLDNLPYGTYTITETSSSLYDILSDNPTIVTISESNINEEIIITNQQKTSTGTIIINKIILNNGVEDPSDTTEFTITLDGSTVLSGVVSQSAPLVFTAVPFGIYSIRETSNPEYSITSITPIAANLTSENTTATVNIINTKLNLTGTITLTKLVTLDDVEVEDGTNFSVTITGPVTQTGILSTGKSLVFEELPLGTYTITEEVVDTHTLVAVTPITLTASSLNQSRQLVNEQVIIPPPIGSITITKQVTYDGNLIEDNTEFLITLNGTSTGYVKVGTPLIFSNLAMGEYTLVESAATGYTLGSVSSPITLTAGNPNQTVNIINIKDSENLGSITVYKNILGIKNVIDYGALYNWYTATDIRNIANTGAHVPSDADWKILEIFLGLSEYEADQFNNRGTDEGGKLKATGFDYWDSPNTAATNSVGFNAKASGDRATIFYNLNQVESFWTTDELSSRGIGRQLFYNNGGIGRSTTVKTRGIAIRLLKNSTILQDGQTGIYIGNDGKVYSTICIGTQEWVAEDLVETKFRNGEDIPIITDSVEWSNLTTAGMCYYNNEDNTFHREIGPILDDTEFEVTITKDLSEFSEVLIQDSPTVFDDLSLGLYTIEETIDNGYTSDIDYPEITLTLGNSNQSVIITNTKETLLGSITIEKRIIGDSPGLPPTFSFTITGTGTNPYTETQSGTTEGPIVFSDLPEDTYTVTESPNSEYPLLSITPSICTIEESQLDWGVSIINSVLNPTFGYGLLYNWYAITKVEAIAAEGWIVPSEEDFLAIQTNYGGALVAGGAMKLPGYVYWNSPNINATNSSLFNGVGAGFRGYAEPASFSDELNYGKFWILAGTSANLFSLKNLSGELEYFSDVSKSLGLSVRLRKLSTTLRNGEIGTYVGNDGQSYRTICIANIEWLGENLKETKYRDGSSIPIITDGTEWVETRTGAMCAYNNDINKI